MATASLTAPPIADIVATVRQTRQRRTRTKPLKTVPKLSIVIVNYCDWQGTAALVRRVLASEVGRQGLLEVVVVDNHSPRHPMIRRLRRWPGVSLRRWRQNRGFARAANQGCRLSRGDWFLLLNPDVTLPDGFLDSVLGMVDRLATQEKRAGVVGFQLRNGDGSRQWSSGPWPTLVSTLAGLVLPRAQRKCRPNGSRHRCRVPWVTGCCLLLRRDCWRQLGGFDEDFFLYYEDVDFCRRARAAGWSIWLEPRYYAIHHRPLHSRAVPPHLRLSTRHGLLTYSAKHWPGWQSRLLAFIVQAEAWVRGKWAQRRGDDKGADTFGSLAALARDFLQGRPNQARRRLNRVMRERISQSNGEGSGPAGTMTAVQQQRTAVYGPLS
jgi:GT2 family glycosyltransferase